MIRKGLFRQSRYEIKNGVLCKSEYSWFGLLHKKSEDCCWNLSEIKYIEKVKILKSLRYAIELVTPQESIYIPSITKKDADNFVNEAISGGVKLEEHKFKFVPSRRSMRKITRGYTIVCEQFDYIVRKVYNREECQVEQVKPESIVYFDELEERKIKGVAFGAIAGGGYANTIEVYGLSKSENKQLYDTIVEANPKLKNVDVKVFKAAWPGSIWSWAKQRETIMLTDWGLIHKQYGVVVNGRKFSSRTSVIPFDSIKSYFYEGRFLKKMQILGSTSMSTDGKFLSEVQKTIWNKFRELGLSNDQGTVFKASLFQRRNQGKILLTSSSVIWILKNEIKVLPFDCIYSYEFVKPKWYSFYGDVAIKGRRVDARSGEGGDIVMEISHIQTSHGKKMMKAIDAGKNL